MSTLTVSQSATGTPGSEPRHGLRILVVWLVLAAICTPLVYFVWGPHMPPGQMSNTAKGQQFDNTVLGALATPVVLFIWVYFGYAIVFFRQRGPELEDGIPLTGSTLLATVWILTTGAIVMFAFVFGTYELSVGGAGGGEGPNPIWQPDTPVALQVQVIAQQWRFSYRFPQFGGVETTSLELPLDQSIQFNVTSLDVIHDFWSYQLGVKADANPSLNNVAYVTPRQLGHFSVRCAELCGTYHGAMFDYGTVVSATDFQTWITQQESSRAALTALLPPYSLTYTPSKDAAGGGYYANDPPSPQP